MKLEKLYENRLKALEAYIAILTAYHGTSVDLGKVFERDVGIVTERLKKKAKN